MASKDFYNAVGPAGLRQLAEDFHIEGDIEFIRQHCKKSDYILDLGCGYGRASVPLAAEGYRVVGIDQSDALIDEARKAALKLNVQLQFDVGDMRMLPYANETFDVLFCLWNSFNELLTSEDQIAALGESYRVLKRGGSAYFFMLDGESPESQEFIQKKKSEGKDPIWESVFFDETIAQFIHSKESLGKLLLQTEISEKSTLQLSTMHNRPRLLLHVQKI